MKGGPKPVRVKWVARAKGATCHQPCYPAQSCFSMCITGIAQHSGITKKQLVCTLIFHFLLLMALPTASALLTITHVSVLLSLHRCTWLSQMFLGLTILAVCSKADLFKQLLFHLDFEMNQVKKACTVHCTVAKGSLNWAGTVVCLSLQEWFKRRDWFKSTLRWLQWWGSQCWHSVSGERLLLALLYPHCRDKKA